MTTAACPLCHVERDPRQQVLRRAGSVRFLVDERQQGALRWSGVIAPVRHAETVFDLAPDEWADSLALLKQVKADLDAAHHPDGYTVGWNCYPVGGQTIMHAHMHVIPRFQQEPYAGRGIRSWLKRDENRWW